MAERNYPGFDQKFTRLKHHLGVACGISTHQSTEVSRSGQATCYLARDLGVVTLINAVSETPSSHADDIVRYFLERHDRHLLEKYNHDSPLGRQNRD